MFNFKFDKIVRAGLFEQWAKDGSIVVTRELTTDEEKYQASLNKVIEEVHEAMRAAPHERATEFADIRAGLEDAERHSGVSEATLRSKPSEKNAFAGRLVVGTLVETVALTPDNPMLPYFLEHYEQVPFTEQA